MEFRGGNPGQRRPSVQHEAGSDRLALQPLSPHPPVPSARWALPGAAAPGLGDDSAPPQCPAMGGGLAARRAQPHTHTNTHTTHRHTTYTHTPHTHIPRLDTRTPQTHTHTTHRHTTHTHTPHKDTHHTQTHTPHTHTHTHHIHTPHTLTYPTHTHPTHPHSTPPFTCLPSCPWHTHSSLRAMFQDQDPQTHLWGQNLIL